MNTKTIFKKPRVIITAVVLALIVALTAVVVILASEKATFKGVQVAADGYINLRFHYTINDESVTKANVYIYDGNQGYLNGGEPEVVDLVTDDAGNTYFSVPLAAAQMGCDVTVVPLDENGTEIAERGSKNAPTWSVKEYADKVLADGSYSDEYHAGLKAIMNYGHYASEYFAVGNNVVENEGIYGRKTNPIIGMTKLLKAGDGPKVTINDELVSNVEIKIALEDSVSIRLYYTYTGDSSHTGQNNPVAGEENRFYVSVDNIGARQYNTPYGTYLGVQVGSQNAVTVENATVISCLEKMMSSEDAKIQNLALALYNFYHWTGTGNKDQATCAHFMHYEYVAEGVTQPVCTYCGKTVNYQVSDEINYFSAPGQMINNWACANDNTWTGSGIGDKKHEFTNIQSENGFDFVRVYLAGNGSMIFGNGTVGYGLNSAVYNQFMNLNAQGNCLNQLMDGQGIGRYVVIKVRTPGAASIELGFLNGSAVHNFGGNKRVSDEVGTDTWQVYVLDLKFSTIINKDATAFNAVFRGNTKGGQDAYVDIAYLAVCDDIREIKQLVADESSIISTNNIFWDKRVDENVFTLEGHTEHTVAYGGSVTDTDGDTVYTYVCSNLCCDELNESIEVPASANYFAAPGLGVTNYNVNTDGSTTFLGANNALTGVSIDGDGTIYTRYYWGNWGSAFLGNGSTTSKYGTVGGANSSPLVVDLLNKNADGTTQGVGQYAVLKLRVPATARNIGFQLCTDKLPTGAEAIANGVRWIGTGCKEFPSNTWTEEFWATYVIDISKVADPTATKVNILITHNGNAAAGAYTDIAYAAICDTWAEVEAVVGQGETIHHLAVWKTNDGTNKLSNGCCLSCTERTVNGTHDYSVGDKNVCYSMDVTTYKCSLTTCPNYNVVKSVETKYINHDLSLPAETSGSTYTYTCGEAGCLNKTTTLTVPAGINFYSAPGQIVNNWGTSSNPSKGGSCGSVTDDHEGRRDVLYDIGIDGDTVYTRINLYNSASAYLTNGTATYNSTNYTETTTASDKLDGGLGQFLVIKLRTSNNTGDGVRIGVRTKDASGKITERQGNGITRLGLISTDGFVTYVMKFTADADEQFINVLIGNKSGLAPVAGAYIDVAYFAVCDSYAEVASLVKNDSKLTYTTSWGDKNNQTVYTKAEHTTHNSPKLASVTTNADGSVTYKYACDHFFCAGYEQTIAAGMNYYSAPGQQVNAYGTGNAASGMVGGGVALNNVIIDENGAYTRIYMWSSGIAAMANGTATPSANNHGEGKAPQDVLTGGLGKYIVFKIRTHGMNNVKFNIAVSTSAGGSRIGVGGIGNASGGAYTIRYEAPTEFTTYIVPVTANADATNIHAIIGHHSAPEAGAYLDLAYFAICDDYAEVAQLIGNETSVKLVANPWNSGAATTYNKADHATHDNLKFQSAVTNSDGSITYKYGCDNPYCAGYEQTTPAGTNFSFIHGKAANMWGTSGTTTTLGGTVKYMDGVRVDEDGIYTRIYMFNSGIAALTNGTVATPSASTHGEGKLPSDALTNGMGQYIVFRIRTSGMTSVKFNIAKNVGGSRVHVDRIGGASGGGYAIREEAPTEFTTYVVKVSADADATHIHAVIGHNNAPAAGAYLDVQYFAVCEDWAAVDAIVGSESVEYIDGNWRGTVPTTMDSAAIDQKVAEEAAQ